MLGRYRPTLAAFVRDAADSLHLRLYRAFARLSDQSQPIGAFDYPGTARVKGPQSSAQRWDLIDDQLDGVQTALDIGCNAGYFSFKLAVRGVFVHAFEPLQELAEVVWVAGRHAAGGERIALSRLMVDKDTIHLLPRVDCVLLMSVMHYWVEAYGWPAAWQMLAEIWSRAERVMFFEIPNPVQNSKMSKPLSMMGSTDAECEQFLSNELGRLTGAEVTLLGYIRSDFRGQDEKRHLFKVTRC
jgi:hypothetical protein